MNHIYEIVDRVGFALEDWLDVDSKDLKAQEAVMNAFRGILVDAKTLFEDGTALLTVPDAVALVDNLNAVCKYFLLAKCPELALEAFAVEVRLPVHVDLSGEDADDLFSALMEMLDDLFIVAWNAKQREPFIDAALAETFGVSPAAMALRNALYAHKADALMRRGEVDAALFCLMEACSSLADSVSQGDIALDDARLGLLRNIRRCLEAKGDRRLAHWVQRKVDIIKARVGDAPNAPAQFRPASTLPPLRKGWPCAAFAMRDAEAAYDHLRGYQTLRRYGEGEPGHWLTMGDEGGRSLGRCPKCGGFVLMQVSEFHGGASDDRYIDYFPVTGPEDAESLNARMDGETIEHAFPEKYLTVSNGQIAWYDLHLRDNA